MQSAVRRLALRDGSCGPDAHSCQDVEHPDRCCDNSSYCYVDRTGDARCCPLGSNCVNDSPCSSDAYWCTVTTTATLPSATSNFTSVALATGCCGRKCPQTSYFLCPSDLGGKCCPYGSECATGEQCLDKRGSATPTATAVVVTETAAAAAERNGLKALSRPQIAGLGVGIACAVVLLIASLVWLVWRMRARNSNKVARRKGDDNKNCAELMDGTSANVVPAQSLGRIAKVGRYFGLDKMATHELETRNPPVELQGESIVGRFELDANPAPSRPVEAHHTSHTSDTTHVDSPEST